MSAGRLRRASKVKGRDSMQNTVTDPPADAGFPPGTASLSLFSGLPTVPAAFRIRVTRSQLAALWGCSKTSITRHVQSGRLIFGPDQRIDAADATAQIMRSGDRRLLRTGVFRTAMDEITALRAEAAKATAIGAEAAALREALAKMTAERDRLAGELAAALQYGDDAARRLFELGAAA